MASKISIEQLGKVGRQAKALGNEAKGAINVALLKGARIISSEASLRAPKSRKHRTNHGQSPKRLAEVITAELITNRKVAGVTVKGGFNGPSYYVKFVEYVDVDSTFLQLAPGDNLIRYDAEEGLSNLEVSIFHNNLYLGV